MQQTIIYGRDGEKVYISIVPNMTREGLNKYSDESKHTERDWRLVNRL